MTFNSRNKRSVKRCLTRHLSVESLEGRRLLAIVGEVGAIPLLHSLPEATTKIFLDFDGNYEQSWSDNEHVVTPPYDIDGDVDRFNELEQARIVETWKRVSEDYAPFNIDVTTEDPADHTTELNEVDATNKRIRTFYFRHEFDLQDAASFRNLQVHLLRDDGAAVYLNGTEIVRDNLSSTARFDSFATSGSSGVNERTYHRFQVDSGLLVDGHNLISVEVHQRSDSSSDVSFDLKLDATQTDGAIAEFIPQHSQWRYLDDGSNQGTLWRAPDFDDSDWSLGTGEFGYGDVVATTHVAIGGSWSDWFGESAGGVAFSGGFHNTGSTTAFVFTRSIADNVKNIAEAASHEAGHTFGLAHQGLFDESTGELIDEYHPGANGWAPIMGVSYDQELTTWHNGPTRTANTIQDNMSILARNGGGYRADDHGDSAATGTSILDSIDDDGFFRIDGIVEKNTDRDAFTFTIDEGQSGVSILLHGIGIDFGQNLDAVIELRDSEDELIQRVDPAHSYDASLESELAPGDYALYVQSNGEYGRVGQYTLSVHIDERPTVVAGFNRLRPLSGGGLSRKQAGRHRLPG